MEFSGDSQNWLVNYSFQFLMSICASIFLFSYYPVALILINHTCLMTEAAVMKVNKLKTPIGIESNPLTHEETGKQLVKIIMATRQIRSWHEELQSFIQFNLLMEFNVLALVICVGVYTLSTSFSASPMIFMMTNVVLFQLFVLCYFGSRVATGFAELATELYETDWFIMEVSQQKEIQMILLSTQNMKPFNGIFSELSLKTFQKVSEFSGGFSKIL